MSEPDIVIANRGPLTRREAEAVLWVAQGKTSWEAGRILGVTEHTHAAHVASASEKLAATNRAHLVARAFVRGILEACVQRAIAMLLAAAFAMGNGNSLRSPRQPLRCRRREEVERVAGCGTGEA